MKHLCYCCYHRHAGRYCFCSHCHREGMRLLHEHKLKPEQIATKHRPELLQFLRLMKKGYRPTRIDS